MSPDSKRALQLSGLVALGVVEAGLWIVYLVRPNWLTYGLVIGLPLVSSYLVYKFRPRLVSESVLVGVNTGVVTTVFFSHPSWLTFALLVVMLGLVVRSILVYVRGTAREARLEAYRQTELPKRVNDKLVELRLKDEEYSIISRLHPVMIVPVVLSASMATGCVFAWWLHGLPWQGTLILLGLILAWCWYVITAWRQEVFCLTNLRLFMTEGVFKKRNPLMDLRKITSYTMEVPAFSRFLSWMRIIKAPYGTLILETASQKESIPKVGPLPNIYAVHKVALTLMLPKGDTAQHTQTTLEDMAE